MRVVEVSSDKGGLYLQVNVEQAEECAHCGKWLNYGESRFLHKVNGRGHHAQYETLCFKCLPD